MYLSISLFLLSISLYFNWKLAVGKQTDKEKYDLQLRVLEKRVQARDEQIKILSDREPIDSGKLLSEGKF